MKAEPFTYLVIENVIDVCEGIERRMSHFENWQSLGYCTGVKEAVDKIKTSKPQMVFLDWGLNGGSAYEVLQQIQNLSGYNPYVLFNTGFQKDNPEIPQEIINNYKVDKYVVKPFWENFRNNLQTYVQEAETKAAQAFGQNKSIWLVDQEGAKVSIAMDKLICICQHPLHARSRLFCMENKVSGHIVPISWQNCIELLEDNKIDYFVTKARSHIVVRSYIEKYEKPFVRLRNFPAKIEVVKEKFREFEEWLVKK